MMAWSRTRTLVLGLALIVVTNTVALIGVSYNRSAVESTLHLTQRELAHPYPWRGARENSGIALDLQWRVLDEKRPTRTFSIRYSRAGRCPALARQSQAGNAGVRGLATRNHTQARRSSPAELSKEALLVLELDGPAVPGLA